jgi:hypothetical protein
MCWMRLTPTLQNNIFILLKSPRQVEKKKYDELEKRWEKVLIWQYKGNQPTENESTDESQNTEKIKHTFIS